MSYLVIQKLIFIFFALICSYYAPSIPKENFSAMTRLDHNRATSQLAKYVGCNVAEVKNVIIWGNHSSTQFPDASHATIGGKPGNILSISIGSYF